MNSLAEVLGMSLPGSAAVPAPYRERQECAHGGGDGEHSGNRALGGPIVAR